jgi:hypothetical protein
MLLTDEKWVERDPVLRAFAKPHQALRGIFWTNENQSFWMLPKPDTPAAELNVGGWHMSDAAVLLQLCQHVGESNVSVYVLDEAHPEPRLTRVERILREEGAPRSRHWLWFETEDGKQSPCVKLIVNAAELPTLVCEAQFV